MENWTKRFLLACGIAMLHLSSTYSLAEERPTTQVIQPDLERREIKTVELKAEDFEVGLYVGILSIQDFESKAVYGVRGAYHFTEDYFFELSYGYSEAGLTTFEKLSGGSPIFSDKDREYKYYDLGFGWNILPGEVFISDKYVFNSSLYLIAGVGSTTFAGDDWFTISFGSGFRLMLNDRFAWHIDVRDHMFDRDVLGADETTHNIEFNTGVTVFF
jgi:outer membrane beta-barrel protein